MAGLIQNQLGTPNVVASTLPKGSDTLADGSSDATVSAGATNIDPAQRTLDKTQTVAGQLGGILSEDSPYVQAAQSNALQTANSRGLINSSIAAGAGTQAAITAALPVAQQDAAANIGVSQDNQKATNDALATNAQLDTNTSVANAGNQVQQLLQAMRGTQAENVANIQGQYQQLIQSNASASQLFSNISKQISDILDNTLTSADQKQVALNKQTQLLQSGLAIIGGISNLDLGSLLNFDPTIPVPPPAPMFDGSAPGSSSQQSSNNPGGDGAGGSAAGGSSGSGGDE